MADSMRRLAAKSACVNGKTAGSKSTIASKRWNGTRSQNGRRSRQQQSAASHQRSITKAKRPRWIILSNTRATSRCSHAKLSKPCRKAESNKESRQNRPGCLRVYQPKTSAQELHQGNAETTKPS